MLPKLLKETEKFITSAQVSVETQWTDTYDIAFLFGGIALSALVVVTGVEAIQA
jgi:hypothetical protein